MIGMVPVQWSLMLAGLPRAPPLLQGFASKHHDQQLQDGTTEFVASLMDAQPSSRTSVIQAMAIRTVKEAAGVELGADDPFQAAGVDSLAQVEVVNSLRKQLGSAVKLSTTMLLDYPTVRALAQHVEESMHDHAALEASGVPGPGMLHHNEGIAVVGMSCYAPGGCGTPGDLWELLCSGHDCIAKIPMSRFNVDGLEGTSQELYVRHGHFVEGVELFDNVFFGIGATEASCYWNAVWAL